MVQAVAGAEKALRAYVETVPENSGLPAHSSAHTYLGRLYENQGRSELAAEQYTKALALDPENEMAKEALRRLQTH